MEFFNNENGEAYKFLESILGMDREGLLQGLEEIKDYDALYEIIDEKHYEELAKYTEDPTEKADENKEIPNVYNDYLGRMISMRNYYKDIPNVRDSLMSFYPGCTMANINYVAKDIKEWKKAITPTVDKVPTVDDLLIFMNQLQEDISTTSCIPNFDWYRQNSVIVCGSSGSGKTAIILQDMFEQAKSGKKVLFIELDTSLNLLMRKYIKPLTSEMSEDELTNLLTNNLLLSNGYTKDNEVISLESLGENIGDDIDFIVIDLLRNIRSEATDEYEKLAIIGSVLNKLKVEKDCTAIGIHQLNKGGTMKGNNDLLYDVDVTLKIEDSVNDLQLDQRRHKVISLEKNRNTGEVGTIAKMEYVEGTFKEYVCAIEDVTNSSTPKRKAKKEFPSSVEVF